MIKPPILEKQGGDVKQHHSPIVLTLNRTETKYHQVMFVNTRTLSEEFHRTSKERPTVWRSVTTNPAS
jgi:hypothetical protein